MPDYDSLARQPQPAVKAFSVVGVAHPPGQHENALHAALVAPGRPLPPGSLRRPWLHRHAHGGTSGVFFRGHAVKITVKTGTCETVIDRIQLLVFIGKKIPQKDLARLYARGVVMRFCAFARQHNQEAHMRGTSKPRTFMVKLSDADRLRLDEVARAASTNRSAIIRAMIRKRHRRLMGRSNSASVTG